MPARRPAAIQASVPPRDGSNVGLLKNPQKNVLSGTSTIAESDWASSSGNDRVIGSHNLVHDVYRELSQSNIFGQLMLRRSQDPQRSPAQAAFPPTTRRERRRSGCSPRRQRLLRQAWQRYLGLVVHWAMASPVTLERRPIAYRGCSAYYAGRRVSRSVLTPFCTLG